MDLKIVMKRFGFEYKAARLNEGYSFPITILVYHLQPWSPVEQLAENDLIPNIWS